MRLKTLIGITILLLGIGTATAQPQEKKKKDTYKASVYLFGFSASFNDSIVYFTDIQKVDNVLLEKNILFKDFLEFGIVFSSFHLKIKFYR